MARTVRGLLSIVGLGSSTPKVDNTAAATNDANQATSNTARAALYATTGGTAGQELNPDQVRRRDTLLGN